MDQIKEQGYDNEPNVEVKFVSPTEDNKLKIIKVIGVGGGGSNAVNYMYKKGIHDVTFALCNTDCQSLSDSQIPVKIQLGKEGLGAGNRPEVARKAAEESEEKIRAMLRDGTRMAFITATMGGGTGTGAAPVIARIAKEEDILTVGIVTIPFKWEGCKKIDQAIAGVEEISKYVDALLVINNEKLIEIYNDLSVNEGFNRANETLSVAAKSIAEIITMHGQINLDFNDVRTVLKDGGVAIMSTGYGEGENRISKAITQAEYSPLLNNNDIFNSKKVLINVSSKDPNDLQMTEMAELSNYMTKFSQKTLETKFGMSYDETLNGGIKITLLATGFGIQDIHMESMDRHLGMQEQEKERLRMEEEEIEEQKRLKREMYYGKDTNSLWQKRYNIYLFNNDTLDNDDVIAMVDNSPTYTRERNMLNQITQKGKKFTGGHEETPSEEPQADESDFVLF